MFNLRPKILQIPIPMILSRKKQRLLDPCPAKLIYLNFQPLEVVSRFRDPQLQVLENHSCLFNLRPEIYKSDQITENHNKMFV